MFECHRFPKAVALKKLQKVFFKTKEPKLCPWVSEARSHWAVSRHRGWFSQLDYPHAHGQLCHAPAIPAAALCCSGDAASKLLLAGFQLWGFPGMHSWDAAAAPAHLGMAWGTAALVQPGLLLSQAAPEQVVLTHLKEYLAAGHEWAVPCPHCPSGLPEWQCRQDIPQEEGHCWDVPETSRSELGANSIAGSACGHSSHKATPRTEELLTCVQSKEGDVICNRNPCSFCFLSLLLQFTGSPLAVWAGIYKTWYFSVLKKRCLGKFHANFPYILCYFLKAHTRSKIPKCYWTYSGIYFIQIFEVFCSLPHSLSSSPSLYEEISSQEYSG